MMREPRRVAPVKNRGGGFQSVRPSETRHLEFGLGRPFLTQAQGDRQADISFQAFAEPESRSRQRLGDRGLERAPRAEQFSLRFQIRNNPGGECRIKEFSDPAGQSEDLESVRKPEKEYGQRPQPAEILSVVTVL